MRKHTHIGSAAAACNSQMLLLMLLGLLPSPPLSPHMRPNTLCPRSLRTEQLQCKATF